MSNVSYEDIKNYTKKVAGAFLFEPNDTHTRDMFKLVVSAFLDVLIEKEELYDYTVVCDERINSPKEIDNNELHLHMAVKRSKDTEFVFLPVAVMSSIAH